MLEWNDCEKLLILKEIRRYIFRKLLEYVELVVRVWLERTNSGKQSIVNKIYLLT